MIKIKTKTSTGESFFPACKILEEINNQSSIAELKNADWREPQTKMDYLTGKIEMLEAIVAEPLSEEDAKQAIDEYRELGYK